MTLLSSTVHPKRSTTFSFATWVTKKQIFVTTVYKLLFININRFCMANDYSRYNTCEAFFSTCQQILQSCISFLTVNRPHLGRYANIYLLPGSACP